MVVECDLESLLDSHLLHGGRIIRD
jgi:hypothetical protein